MEVACPGTLTFPWQPYFDRHVLQNSDIFLIFNEKFSVFERNFTIFVSF